MLPAEIPARPKRFLKRFGEEVGAALLAEPLARAPAEGFVLLWLGGSEGRDLKVAASLGHRLELLATNRAGLRPLALRLKLAAMIDEDAFMRAETGLPTTAGEPSGLYGLRQAPLEAGPSLGVGDYVSFQGTGEPLANLLKRYLDWRALD